MKRILEVIIQKRNPNFQFDPSITLWMLIGLFLEKGWYIMRGWKRLLHFKKPQMLMLGRKVKFFHAANMELGRWVKVEDYVYLNALGRGKLVLGDHVGIGAFSRIIISTSFNHIGSHITIGNNVGIGEYAYLGGGGGLEIGDDCIIGQYFSCHPENHHFEDEKLLIREQGVSRQGIKIGKNCWIGSKVTILDGVTIGDHCVIAAGAVVTKNMPSHSVIGGVPAKALKSIPVSFKEVA